MDKLNLRIEEQKAAVDQAVAANSVVQDELKKAQQKMEELRPIASVSPPFHSSSTSPSKWHSPQTQPPIGDYSSSSRAESSAGVSSSSSNTSGGPCMSPDINS